MDPLSISASVLTLIQAAAATTSCLQKFIKSVRRADSRLSDLCNELITLAGFLDAIDRSVKQFQQSNALLSPINDDIWRQSLIALEDCQTSLSELEELVTKVKNGRDRSRSTRLWRLTRITLAISLDSHTSEIDHLRNKIHKSNCALQTMLSVFNVSLSLRSNTSQDLILSELAKLKDYIEYSIHAAGVPKTPSGLNDMSARQLESQSQVARNLKGLAQAAKIFYTTASTTASSMCRSSLSAIMPSFTRERIQGFINTEAAPGASTRHTMVSEMDWGSLPHPTKTPQDNLKPESHAQRPIVVDPDVESDLEILFFRGLEERATESVRIGDIQNAQVLLERAIYRHGNSQRNRTDVNRLQIQLSLCYIFLGKWREAEPLVQQMAQLKITSNEVISDLFHALAVAYVTASSFLEAMRLCRQSLNIKKKLLGPTDASYHLTMGLLATIYDEMDEGTYGDIIRDSLPFDFTYQHPSSIKSLIRDKLGLFQSVFGVDGTGWSSDELTDFADTEEALLNENEITNTAEAEFTNEAIHEHLHVGGQDSHNGPDIQANGLLSRTLRRFTTIPRRSSRIAKKSRQSEPAARKEHQSAHLIWRERNKRSTQSRFPFFWKRKTMPISKSDIRILRNNSFPQLAVVAPARQAQPLRARSPSPRPPFKADPISEGPSTEPGNSTDDNQAETSDATDTQSVSSGMSFSSLLDEFEDADSCWTLLMEPLVVNGRPDSMTIPRNIWDASFTLPPSEKRENSQDEDTNGNTASRDLGEVCLPPTKPLPRPPISPLPTSKLDLDSPKTNISRTLSELSVNTRFSDSYFELRALRDSDLSIFSKRTNRLSCATSFAPSHSRTASASSRASKRTGVVVLPSPTDSGRAVASFVPDVPKLPSPTRKSTKPISQDGVGITPDLLRPKNDSQEDFVIIYDENYSTAQIEGTELEEQAETWEQNHDGNSFDLSQVRFPSFRLPSFRLPSLLPSPFVRSRSGDRSSDLASSPDSSREADQDVILEKLGLNLISQIPVSHESHKLDQLEENGLDQLERNLITQNGGKYLWSALTVEPSRADGFDPFF